MVLIKGTVMTKKKVYCSNCKYFHVDAATVSYGSNALETCKGPTRVFEDRYDRRYDITIPCEKNKNNDCIDYKPKE